MTELYHPDDIEIARAISECHLLLQPLSALNKVTVAYNLLAGCFRVCCVCGDREELLILADQVREGLIEEINFVGEEE